MRDSLPADVAALDAYRAKQNGNGQPPAAPPGVEPAGEGAAVLDAVHAFLRRFVRYPSEHAHVAHVLWIAHTHLMAAWFTTPRLAFMSAEKESGKTRALEVTELLVPEPILSLNISPAALVRKVADGEATVLYDEIDALFGNSSREEANVDVRSILNGGYRRGAKVHRCVVRGKAVELEAFDAFAPVALAGLRTLPDTLASRGVIIRMERRAPDERIESFRIRRVQPEAEVLRDRLALWCRDISSEVQDAEPDMPAGIVDRAAECWEPLLAVADAAGGDWPKLARAAASALVSGSVDETQTPGTELLADIQAAFGDDDKLHTKELLGRLVEQPESPWKDIRGRELDDRGLASRLKPYRIKSANVKIAGVVKKGYYVTAFTEAWKRYLPGARDLSATAATNATTLNNKNNAVAEVALVADNTGTCAHCGDGDRPDDPVLEVHVDGRRVDLHRGCEGAYFGDAP